MNRKHRNPRQSYEVQALLEFAHPAVMGKMPDRPRDFVPALTGVSYDDWYDWQDSQLEEGEPKYERAKSVPSEAQRKLREDLLGVLNRLRRFRQMDSAPGKWAGIAGWDRDTAFACHAVFDRWESEPVAGSNAVVAAPIGIQTLLRGLHMLMDSWWEGKARLSGECPRCGKFMVQYLHYPVRFCSDSCAKDFHNEKRPSSSK